MGRNEPVTREGFLMASDKGFDPNTVSFEDGLARIRRAA